MATNRADTLDPALLRPGRLDRKIEFPMPSRRERRLIFQTCTGKMNLGPDVDLEDCQSSYSLIHMKARFDILYRVPIDVSRPDRLSAAEIAAIVQAAGLQGMVHARRSHHTRNTLTTRSCSCTQEPLYHPPRRL